MGCSWCTNDTIDGASAEHDAPNFGETLCLAHQAEYEGLTISELLRRESEEAMDLV